MRNKTEPCVVCGTEVTVPVINEPWCKSCTATEQERHAREDSLGRSVTRFGVTVPTMKRPPKYAVAKVDWRMFGYSDSHSPK